jgi:hypothetical protein
MMHESFVLDCCEFRKECGVSVIIIIIAAAAFVMVRMRMMMV